MAKNTPLVSVAAWNQTQQAEFVCLITILPLFSLTLLEEAWTFPTLMNILILFDLLIWNDILGDFALGYSNCIFPRYLFTKPVLHTVDYIWTQKITVFQNLWMRLHCTINTMVVISSLPWFCTIPWIYSSLLLSEKKSWNLQMWELCNWYHDIQEYTHLMSQAIACPKWTVVLIQPTDDS